MRSRRYFTAHYSLFVGMVALAWAMSRASVRLKRGTRATGRGLKWLLRPAWRAFWRLLPRQLHVCIDHLRFHGTLPNLKNPSTFSEKIMYRKLHDLDPRMPLLIDKISAKEQMAERFGKEFVIPTLATFESEAEIDFEVLAYPCVLKANHGSDMNVFLESRPLDEGKVRRGLRGFMRRKHHESSEEWAYSRVRPRLLAEPFIASGEHGLIDYKFHTFDGKVFAIQVDVDRFTDHKRCFFDTAWKRMPVELLYPRANFEIPPPEGLQQMLTYASQIGLGFEYVRVDLYEVDGKIKFGEATFYPGAGIEQFKPQEYDRIFGAQWGQAVRS